jgi:hypothetical protein
MAELREAESSAISVICSQGTSPTSSTVRTGPRPATATPGTTRSSSGKVAKLANGNRARSTSPRSSASAQREGMSKRRSTLSSRSRP